MNIEIISGSPRHESMTVRVALYLKDLFSTGTSHNISLIDVRDQPQALIQKVITSVANAPEEYRPLAERMFAADAFILVSPEYNGGYSPALKNLLDHFPKQMHKAFGIVTASPGAMGGMRAALQLQLLVNALFGIGSPYMLVTPAADKKFDASGKLLDETFLNSIHTFRDEFLWLAERISK